jgi:hypothetical protein
VSLDFNAYLEYAKSLDASVEAGEAQSFVVVCADLKDLLTNSSAPLRPNPQIEISGTSFAFTLIGRWR